MSNENILNINGVMIPSSKLTYENLVWLVNNYCKTHENLRAIDFKSSNNLPSYKAVKHILNKQNIDILDFLNSFDKHSVNHCSYNPKKYNEYVEKYIEISKKSLFPLSSNELKKYDLPLDRWFIKNCPDKTVNTWSDFVKWCGFTSSLKEKSLEDNKNIIAQKLIEYEKEIGRPIKLKDINCSTVGFCNRIIYLLWGSFSNCKKEIGLKSCEWHLPKTWDYYVEQSKIALNNIYENTHSYDFSWQDFMKYKKITLSKKTIKLACQRENINLYDFFNSLGFNLMPNNGIGKTKKYEDGEICVSTLEQKFTSFLRDNNIKYKRNVKYNTLDDLLEGRKYNCDYVIDNKYWIEVCGLSKGNSANWKSVNCSNQIELKYKTKLLLKEVILRKNNIPFLFLFQEDFDNNAFQEKTFDLIKSDY